MTIICIAPVKNEAWIIERFLSCASVWADIVILADQLSEDKTVSIASHFPKARIVSNPSSLFNEPQRQGLLFQEARKTPGKKLIIALDADECLSANFGGSPEWKKMLGAKPGTCISFDWVNIAPDLKNHWQQPGIVRGFMDDGVADFSPVQPIHTEKVPRLPDVPVLECKDIKLLHYQYTDWNRMRSKHNWYQAWEALNFPEKSPVTIFRTYHHMFAVPVEALRPLQNEWFGDYEKAGIEMLSVRKEEKYYWDAIIEDFLQKHGARRFSKIDLWWRKWEGFDDPRTNFEKVFHWYLRKTQHLSRAIGVRVFDKILKMLLL